MKKIILSLLVLGLIGGTLFARLPHSKHILARDLEAMGFSFSLPRRYEVKLTLPQAPFLSEGEKDKARRILQERLGIEEEVTTPTFFITQNNDKIWKGFVRFGQTTINLLSPKEMFTEEDASYTSTLLEAELDFKVKGEKAWANIFLVENGSLLEYVSITLQNGRGNLVAMFTYGKPPIKKDKKALEEGRGTSGGIHTGNSTVISSTDPVLALKARRLNYSTLYDPFGQLNPRSVLTLRTDAMALSPFPTSSGSGQTLNIRSWGFHDQIEQWYRDVYSRFGTSPWAHAGIYQVIHSTRTLYLSNLVKSASYPEDSDFRYVNIPIPVGFILKVLGLPNLPISYTINVPTDGIKREWKGESTLYPGYNDKATLEVLTRGANYADTFDSNWRTSLRWPGTIQEANNLLNPSSSYDGFYSLAQIFNYAYGTGFYANYYSKMYYAVRAGNGALWDIYYLSFDNTLLSVQLDTSP